MTKPLTNTDIPLQLLLSKLKPRQLRELLLEQLTRQTIAIEAIAILTSTPAASAGKAVPDYVLLDAAGNVVGEDSPDVAVIQDNTTGLQWGAKALLDGKQMPQAECEAEGKKCNLLGGTDWQLASIQQRRTVEDLTRYAPAVKLPFAKFWPKDGWSWTRREPMAAPDLASGCAWGVGLLLGYSDIDGRGDHGCALVCRPVPGVVSSPRQ